MGTVQIAMASKRAWHKSLALSPTSQIHGKGKAAIDSPCPLTVTDYITDSSVTERLYVLKFISSSYSQGNQVRAGEVDCYFCFNSITAALPDAAFAHSEHLGLFAFCSISVLDYPHCVVNELPELTAESLVSGLDLPGYPFGMSVTSPNTKVSFRRGHLWLLKYQKWS